MGPLAWIALGTLVVLGLMMFCLTCANARWEPRRRGKTATLARFERGLGAMSTTSASKSSATPLRPVAAVHAHYDPARRRWTLDHPQAHLKKQPPQNLLHWVNTGPIVVKPERHTTGGTLVRTFPSWSHPDTQAWLRRVADEAPSIAQSGLCVQPFIAHDRAVRLSARRVGPRQWRLEQIIEGPADLALTHSETSSSTEEAAAEEEERKRWLSESDCHRCRETAFASADLGRAKQLEPWRVVSVSDAERAAYEECLARGLGDDLSAVSIDAIRPSTAKSPTASTTPTASTPSTPSTPSLVIVEINGAFGLRDSFRTGPSSVPSLLANFLGRDVVPWFTTRAWLGARNLVTGQCQWSDCGPWDALEAQRARSEAARLAATTSSSAAVTTPKRTR